MRPFLGRFVLSPYQFCTKLDKGDFFMLKKSINLLAILGRIISFDFSLNSGTISIKAKGVGLVILLSLDIKGIVLTNSIAEKTFIFGQHKAQVLQHQQATQELSNMRNRKKEGLEESKQIHLCYCKWQNFILFIAE